MRTVQEWLQLVDSEFENYVSTNYGDFNDGHGWDELNNTIRYKKLQSPKVAFELVDSYGGEGEGERYYFVFKIHDLESNEIVYIKFDGFYNSWEGTEWDDDPFFVTPVQKTITVYER